MEQTRGGVQLRSAFLSSYLYLKTAAFFCIEISCEKGQLFFVSKFLSKKDNSFPRKKSITFHTLSLL